VRGRFAWLGAGVLTSHLSIGTRQSRAGTRVSIPKSAGCSKPLSCCDPSREAPALSSAALGSQICAQFFFLLQPPPLARPLSASYYSFPNIEPGTYELSATAKGFRPLTQTGISLVVGQIARVDLKLEVGTDVQTVKVEADASQLNFENAVHQEGVSPEIINELPLVVSGGPRNSAQMAVLLPGVNTGTSSSAYDARINGGLKSGDEAVMDGVSMQEGTMSQSGMAAFYDFRMTPDMISEFRVMTSSYSPEYGDSTGGQIIVTTKSGTDQYHGSGFEYLRNKALNATQFTIDRQPGDQRPKDNEHEFGFSLGGPLRIPKIYNGKRFRTYFFTDIEFFRIAGGASRPTISIPSMQERQGDFRDWPYPIYDPTTPITDLSATAPIRFCCRPCRAFARARHLTSPWDRVATLSSSHVPAGMSLGSMSRMRGLRLHVRTLTKPASRSRQRSRVTRISISVPAAGT
jgi:hypothetical protein